MAGLPYNQNTINTTTMTCAFWYHNGHCSRGGACLYAHHYTQGMTVANFPRRDPTTGTSMAGANLWARQNVSGVGASAPASVPLPVTAAAAPVFVPAASGPPPPALLATPPAPAAPTLAAVSPPASEGASSSSPPWSSNATTSSSSSGPSPPSSPGSPRPTSNQCPPTPLRRSRFISLFASLPSHPVRFSGPITPEEWEVIDSHAAVARGRIERDFVMARDAFEGAGDVSGPAIPGPMSPMAVGLADWTPSESERRMLEGRWRRLVVESCW